MRGCAHFRGAVQVGPQNWQARYQYAQLLEDRLDDLTSAATEYAALVHHSRSSPEGETPRFEADLARVVAKLSRRNLKPDERHI